VKAVSEHRSSVPGPGGAMRNLSARLTVSRERGGLQVWLPAAPGKETPEGFLVVNPRQARQFRRGK
jgi:hypothetical protein